MTDEQRKVYNKAERLVLKKRICPKCRAPLFDIGERSNDPKTTMRGHLACPTHSTVYGDCFSDTDGKGGYVNSSLWGFIFPGVRRG